MRSAALALVVSLTALTLSAAPWRSHGPANGTISRIAVAPSDRNIIYVTAPDGVFRSRDGGASWVNVTHSIANPLGVVVDPGNPDVVVVSASNGAFRSTDGGDVWQQAPGVPSPSIPRELLVDPRDPNVILLATTAVWPQCESGSIYKSTDGARTFALLHPFGCVDGFMMDPLQPDRLYVSWTWWDSFGVYRSDDGGDTWEWAYGPSLPDPAPDHGPILAGSDMRRYALRRYSMITSVDGVTWSGIQVAAGIESDGGSWPVYSALAIDPLSGRLFLGTSNGAYRSGNGGIHWLRLEAVSRESTNDIHYDPATGEALFATDLGLFHSPGFPWNDGTDLRVGNSAMPISVVVADASDPSVYALSGRHLFRSDDLGRSWDVLGDPLPSPDSDITVDAGHDVYANDLWDGNHHIQKLSADGHWNEIRTVGYLSGLVADPQAPGTLYALELDLARTRDGGVTWEIIPLPNGASPLFIVIDPRNTNRLTALAHEGIMKSTDGGATWSVHPRGDQFVVMQWIVAAPSNPDILYASVREPDLGPPTLARSEDGGLTWSVLPIELVNDTFALPAIHPRDPDTIFVTTYRYGLLFRSTDAGRSWQSIEAGLPVNDVFSLAIDSDGAFLHAGSATRGVWELPLTPRRRSVRTR